MESSIATVANIFTIVTSVLVLWGGYRAWRNRSDKSQKMNHPEVVKDSAIIPIVKRIVEFLNPQPRVSNAEKRFLKSIAESDHCGCKWKELIPALWFSRHTEEGYEIYFTKARKAWHMVTIWITWALVLMSAMSLFFFICLVSFELTDYTPWALLGHAISYFFMGFMFLWLERDYNVALRIIRIQEKEAVDAKHCTKLLNA